MAEQRIEFGKRRPLPPPPATPPVKRSGHVALLVMGTLAVGGTAYALMPRQQNCPQQDPAVAGQPPSTDCPTRRAGGDNESRSSSSTHVADASSAHVSRGGFGGFAHAFGFGHGG